MSIIRVWHWEECSVSFDCPFCHAEIILCEAGDKYTCHCGARFQITQSVIVTPPTDEIAQNVDAAPAAEKNS